MGSRSPGGVWPGVAFPSAQIGEGLRLTWSDRIMRAVLVSGGHSLEFSSMTTALFVPFLVRDLGAGPVAVGVVTSASGAGGPAGAGWRPG